MMKNSSVQSKFTPTQEMLTACKAVVQAMAIVETVRPIVLRYQTDILAKGQWRVSKEHLGENVSDEVITEPGHSFLMSADDFAKYHAQCDEARVAARLAITRDGNCPLLEAEELLRLARRELVRSMADVTKITVEQALVLPLDKYHELVELTLRLLVPSLYRTTASQPGS